MDPPSLANLSELCPERCSISHAQCILMVHCLSVFCLSQVRWTFLFLWHMAAFQRGLLWWRTGVWLGFPRCRGLPTLCLGLCTGCWTCPGAWRSGSDQGLSLMLWRADGQEGDSDDTSAVTRERWTWPPREGTVGSDCGEVGRPPNL